MVDQVAQSVAIQGPRSVSKRWYDSYSDIVKSVKLLETFPEAILGIIAQGVVTIAEDEFYAAELLTTVRSLGWEKVSALYKSKQKARSFDQSPELHKTMNYLYLMSDENRKALGTKMVELVNYVYDYLKSCQAYRQGVSKEEIGNLVDCYVKEGSLEARKFLNQLVCMFKEKSAKKSRTIREGRQDMKVQNS